MKESNKSKELFLAHAVSFYICIIYVAFIGVARKQIDDLAFFGLSELLRSGDS